MPAGHPSGDFLFVAKKAEPVNRCTKCQQEKPETEFYEFRGYIHRQCKACETAQQRERRKRPDVQARDRETSKLRALRNHEGRLASSRRHKHKKINVTDEAYKEMLDSQNRRCAICGEQPNGISLAVDHNHETGKVRGLLCRNCNLALGLFKDNQTLLASAKSYLERN